MSGSRGASADFDAFRAERYSAFKQAITELIDCAQDLDALRGLRLVADVPLFPPSDADDDGSWNEEMSLLNRESWHNAYGHYEYSLDEDLIRDLRDHRDDEAIDPFSWSAD